MSCATLESCDVRSFRKFAFFILATLEKSPPFFFRLACLVQENTYDVTIQARVGDAPLIFCQIGEPPPNTLYTSPIAPIHPAISSSACPVPLGSYLWNLPDAVHLIPTTPPDDKINESLYASSSARG